MREGKPIGFGDTLLENFLSPIDSTVASKLESAGATFVEYDVCQNNQTELSDSVNSLLCGNADFALCNDYSGAISREAAKNGLFYIHPTYGTVSRFGLVPMVASMDQIGIICKSCEDGFKVLDIIKGYDSKDGIMHDSTHDTNKQYQDINNLSADDIKVGEATLTYSDIIEQVMQILCSAEITANVSRYDGIKFGYRAKTYKSLQELYKNSRSELFNSDLKLATLVGNMVLSEENYVKYYDRALRLRRLIKDSISFDEFDVLRIPSDFAAISRLCGLPSLTAPNNFYVARPSNEKALAIIAKSDR